MFSKIAYSPYQHQKPLLNRQNRENKVIPFRANENPDHEKPFIFVGTPMPSPVKKKEERKKWDEIYGVIKKLASPRGAKARRIDEIMNESLEKGNSIERRITKAIDDSDIVIVDLSKPNPNVYFEYGYAAGKGKNIIPIARHGTELPFDVRNNQTVFYNSYDKASLEKEEPYNLQKDLGNFLSSLLKKVKNENKNSV